MLFRSILLLDRWDAVCGGEGLFFFATFISGLMGEKREGMCSFFQKV